MWYSRKLFVSLQPNCDKAGKTHVNKRILIEIYKSLTEIYIPVIVNFSNFAPSKNNYITRRAYDL